MSRGDPTRGDLTSEAMFPRRATIERMDDTNQLIEAMAAIRRPGLDLATATARAPRQPGIYGIYGDAAALVALDLEPALDGQPLYIGKAEESITGRDVHDHFGGPSGKSTVRRSLAALLRLDLGFRARPRNTSAPSKFTHYALDGDGERRLSDWMALHLRLSWWVAPSGATLKDVEKALIQSVAPPLNLVHAPRRSPRLVSARAAMAQEARGWRPQG